MFNLGLLLHGDVPVMVKKKKKQKKKTTKKKKQLNTRCGDDLFKVEIGDISNADLWYLYFGCILTVR